MKIAFQSDLDFKTVKFDFGGYRHENEWQMKKKIDFFLNFMLEKRIFHLINV